VIGERNREHREPEEGKTMTRLTTKLMIAAAALVAAGAASAQTTMKADIPFAFQAGGKTMAAGTYEVVLRGGGANTVIIRRHNYGAVLASPVTQKEGKVETAKLVFACTHGTCSLSQIWPGYSDSGLEFKTPKLDPREQASLAVVPLRVGAGD
jgi:hypothetical protein